MTAARSDATAVHRIINKKKQNAKYQEFGDG